ncbi:MAG: MnmC family methyltransferase [Cyanobacteria bacterium P01_C01_bin.121]
MDKDGEASSNSPAANRENSHRCEEKQKSNLEKRDTEKNDVERFTPIETGDGSCTFYSQTFGEWFHSRDGAFNEAQKTYVEASNLTKRAEGNSLKILDVCYGLGYNTAAALEAIWQVNPRCQVEVQALEIDIEVPRSAIAQGLTQRYPPEVQGVLDAIATQGKVELGDPDSNKKLLANLRLGDARQQIQPLVEAGWQADVVFLDPFSPPHCPQLWTVEFLQLVASCLNPYSGVIVTYSCAAAVRSALKLSGLSIGSTHLGGRKWPGTIAQFLSENLPPLSLQEIEHLQTRAAVPYRDPNLQATAEDILSNRLKEQNTSTLLPTKPWRLRWQQRC